MVQKVPEQGSSQSPTDMELKRHNMLDDVQHRMNEQSKTILIDRMVVVCELAKSVTQTELEERYESLFKGLNIDRDLITGLLIHYPKHIIHIVEGPWRALCAVNKDIHDSQLNGEGLFGASRILMCISDVSSRSFPVWALRSTNVGASSDVYESSDPPEGVAVQIVLKLQQIGLHLGKMKKDDMENGLDQLGETVPELMPQVDQLNWLLKEALTLFDIKGFMKTFVHGVDVALESELVWPIPQRLFPYD
eukprot:Nk52_evm1s858 gene=Nk52_evmTU1s858